jgi:YebC/PmpR family DNA-binding regulatory protein
MSGHSKWSTIKRKKAAIDAKRGDLFGKFARAISVAARDNPDPETNHQLRDVVQRARTANMPSGNIERAIKKVSDKDTAALTEIQLEFLGPGGTALIATGITDNSNRTISELRKVASDADGRMVNQGSVSWMFRKAMLIRAHPGADGDIQQLAVIDAGADDVSTKDNELLIIAPIERAEAVRTVLGDSVVDSLVSYVAITQHAVNERELKKLRTLIEALEGHNDIQDVVTNVSL